jgi:hypothetical protein
VIVYKKAELAPLQPLDFELANGCKLSALNRWVKMAQILPWSEFESEYATNFPTEKGALAFIISDGIGSINYQIKIRN